MDGVRPTGSATATNLFRSFKRRDFRFLWLSDGMGGWADQMELVVLGWFVLLETDSPFMVGLYAALRSTGTLLSPLYGIVIDRYNRKKLLRNARTGFAVIAAAFFILSATDRLEVWHVFALAAILGMVRAFDNVTRQTLIADVVDREGLMNAVALTRSGRDTTQIVGPVVAGVMLSRAGMGASYGLIVGVYLAGVAFAYQLRTPSGGQAGRGASLMTNLSETAAYIGSHQVILALLLMAFLVNLTALPLSLGLMPVYARDALGASSNGLGQLLAANAVGGFTGSVAIAVLPNFRRPGAVILVASLAWHALILAVTRVRWFGPSLPVLWAAGIAQSFTMVTMTVALLSVTSPELRGRVNGVRSMAVYGLPIGLLTTGGLADVLGITTAMAISGAVGMFFTLLVTVRLRGLWRLSQESDVPARTQGASE